MTTDRPPTAPRRESEAVLRVLRHEWTLAALGGLLLAVVLTWPTLRDITTTIPQDIGDPTLQAWQIAWGGHALTTDPAGLWHSNTFFPERFTYAYSDTLLGYAPFGMIGEGYAAAVARYNILYVLAHALAFVGAYALVRQLGAGWIGAAVAGVSFGFAPWRLAQAGHLHVLSVGGIALALAMLARGHGWSLRHGYRPERGRPGWALAGWLVAAWQMTLGFGIGLPFGYLLALCTLAAVAAYGWSWWRRGRRPLFGRRLLVADLVGGVVFAGVTLAMALPYLRVVELHPAGRRTIAHLEMFSPPLRGFVTAPPESWLWGERHAAAREALSFPGEMTLLPGVVLIGLAFAGLFISVWRFRVRLLLAAGVAVSVALAMGTEFAGGGEPGYVTLYNLLPGWDGLRTPGRLVLWTTLLLGVLAAGALTSAGPATDAGTDEPERAGEQSRPAAVPAEGSAGGEPVAVGSAGGESVPAVPAASVAAVPAGDAGRPVLRAAVPPASVTAADDAATAGSSGADDRPAESPLTRRLVRLAALLPLLLVIVEGINTTPHPQVLPQPAALRQAQGPLLVLPSDGILELSVMLWSTDGFPRIVNGLASFTPESQQRTRAAAATFPDAASVSYLRDLGIRQVVLLPGYAAGTPWQDAASRPIEGLGLRREEVDGAVVYHLD